jgi:hypothetical protein
MPPLQQVPPQMLHMAAQHMAATLPVARQTVADAVDSNIADIQRNIFALKQALNAGPDTSRSPGADYHHPHHATSHAPHSPHATTYDGSPRKQYGTGGYHAHPNGVHGHTYGHTHSPSHGHNHTHTHSHSHGHGHGPAHGAASASAAAADARAVVKLVGGDALSYRQLARYEALLPIARYGYSGDAMLRWFIAEALRLTPRFAEALQHVVELVGVYAGDMAQRDPREARRDLRRQAIVRTAIGRRGHTSAPC